MPYGRLWAVAWIEHGIVRKRKQLLADGTQECVVITARKIRASNASGEQAVAAETQGGYFPVGEKGQPAPILKSRPMGLGLW